MNMNNDIIKVLRIKGKGTKDDSTLAGVAKDEFCCDTKLDLCICLDIVLSSNTMIDTIDYSAYLSTWDCLNLSTLHSRPSAR